MKSLFKPIEFIAPLSLPVARITLRELCGSVIEDYPFDGEVEDTSFKLVENYRGRRRYPFHTLAIIGSLAEENDSTRVTVTAQNYEKNKILAYVVSWILIIAAIIYSFVSGPPGIVALIIVSILECVLWPLFYLIAYLRFKHLVKRIKKALNVT